jgi:hypothetical protein
VAIVFAESAPAGAGARARAAEAKAKELHRKAGEVWRAGDHRGATRYRVMAEEQEKIAKAERERAAGNGKNEAAEFHLGDTNDMAIIFEAAAAPAPPVTEASLAGIQATAGAPAGPGPGNGSAPDSPDTENRGGPPPVPPQGAFPASIRPDTVRRARLRAAAMSQFGGAAMVLGNMGAMAEQVGEGVYDLHYDNGQISAVVRGVGYMDLDESAPPSSEAEEWVLANKKEFKRRYGAQWRSYLYGKAWKLFGKDKEKPAVKKEAGDAALEIYAGEGGVLVFSAIGESAAARDALLLEVSRAIAAGRGLSVLTEGSILEVATEKKAKEKAKPVSDWKMRRSLTDEEKARLKVPHSEIAASVSHVPNHGYVVHTHRARSGFYKTPGAIPARSIRYISSTS